MVKLSRVVNACPWERFRWQCTSPPPGFSTLCDFFEMKYFCLWKILVWALNLFEFIRVYVLRLVGFHCHLIFLFVYLFLDFLFVVSFPFWRRRIAVRATYSISRQRSCYPPLQIAWPLYMTSGESRTFTNQDNLNQFITDVWNNIVSQDLYE